MTISPLSELLKATTLEFTIWHDPVAAVDGIPADSDDALVWWTPTLGPTAVLVLHRISRYLTTSGAGISTLLVGTGVGLAGVSGVRA